MDLKDKKAANQLETKSQTTGKSYVQKFFKKEGENSAKCNICLKVYVFKTGGPTSSLKRHLDEKHREILKVNEKRNQNSKVRQLYNVNQLIRSSTARNSSSDRILIRFYLVGIFDHFKRFLDALTIKEFGHIRKFNDFEFLWRIQ